MFCIDDYSLDGDVTLQGVDPRTISPTSNSELDLEQKAESNITEAYEELDHDSNKRKTITKDNVSPIVVNTDIAGKGQRKFIIKARRNLKTKVNSCN